MITIVALKIFTLQEKIKLFSYVAAKDIIEEEGMGTGSIRWEVYGCRRRKNEIDEKWKKTKNKA